LSPQVRLREICQVKIFFIKKEAQDETVRDSDLPRNIIPVDVFSRSGKLGRNRQAR
jgi:hypothetical protein